MIDVRFENIDEIRRVYDSDIVTKATRGAVIRLRDRTATQVGKAVRTRYPVKKREVADAMRKRTRERTNNVEGLLIYTSRRLSLPRFATQRAPTRSNRPRVQTRRGPRYGAKVQIIKGRGHRQLRGAVFWGRARTGQGSNGRGQGTWQIWTREGRARDSIRRLTGPSISHMVRSQSVQRVIADFARYNADKILIDRFNFYIGRRAGIL